MKLDRYLFTFPRNAEGASPGASAGGDGGGAPGGGSSPAAGATPPAPGAAPAPGGAGNDAPAGPSYPEWLPENLRGKDAGEALDKAWNALHGYRQKESARDIPADAKGYLSTEGLKDFAIEEAFKPHFEQLGTDPVFEPMAAKAKELGIGRAEFLSLWQTGMKSMSEGGMLEPMLDPAAERAALLPEAAKNLPKAQQDQAIDARMKENYDFLDLMAVNGGLDKGAREYAELMLGDSAKGHAFFEWMRGRMQGGGAQPGAHGAGGAGGDTAASLKAEMSKPELTPGHPSFDKAKYDDLDARYKKLHGGQA